MKQEQGRAFVYSRGTVQPEAVSGNTDTDGTSYDASSTDDLPLSVDLIGPPLLFRGLLSVVFGFPEVARTRLLPSLPEARYTPLPEPLPPLQVPARSVALLWHECASAGLPLSEVDGYAVLYGASQRSLDARASPSVALSLFDPPGTLQTGLLAASQGRPFRSSLLDVPSSTTAESPSSLPARPKLSAREREIAGQAAADRSNEEIAARLFLSVATVKTHLNRAFAKLGVQSRSQLRHALAEQRPHITPSVPAPTGPIPPLPPEYAEILVHTKEGFLMTFLIDSL